MYNILEFIAKVSLPCIIGIAVGYGKGLLYCKYKLYCVYMDYKEYHKGIVIALNICSLILLLAGFGLVFTAPGMEFPKGVTAVLRDGHYTWASFKEYHNKFATILYLIINLFGFFVFYFFGTGVTQNRYNRNTVVNPAAGFTRVKRLDLGVKQLIDEVAPGMSSNEDFLLHLSNGDPYLTSIHNRYYEKFGYVDHYGVTRSYIERALQSYHGPR